MASSASSAAARVAAAASPRIPLQRPPCLRRRAPPPLLRLLPPRQLPLPLRRPGLQAAPALRPQQPRRHASSSGGPTPPPLPPPPPPPVTLTQFVRHLFRASVRNLAVALSPRGIRSAYRDSPAITSMLVALLALTSVLSFFALKSFILAFYNAEFGRYPEPVANTLRRAIYYTNVQPDPELALRFYKKAMEQCAEVGLDPFSDEVLGIRIQVSFWLEKINNHKAAADVLESVLADCKKWIAVMEQSVQDGQVDNAGRYRPGAAAPETPAGDAAEPAPAGPADGNRSGERPGEQTGDGQAEAETLWQKRQRLLTKAIGTSVKLGELYSDEHALDADKSHAHLVWAVETSLGELQRRQSQGPKPGEQAWLGPEELGGSMESLGHDYVRRSQPQLAVPLFFQALRMCESPCHRAVIMNNLSAAFGQQPPYGPTAAAGASPTLRDLVGSAAPMTRRDGLEAALNWARNAHAHARDVRGDDRTAECDEACAAALCNWADAAAMLGRPELARAKYGECLEMSRRMGFAQGLKQAGEGLARLTSTAGQA